MWFPETLPNIKAGIITPILQFNRNVTEAIRLMTLVPLIQRLQQHRFRG